MGAAAKTRRPLFSLKASAMSMEGSTTLPPADPAPAANAAPEAPSVPVERDPELISAYEQLVNGAPETPSSTPRPTEPSAPASAPQAGGDGSHPAASSWQPDDATVALARQLGVPDEVLRGFGSADEFASWRKHTERFLQHRGQQAQPPASPPSQETQQPPPATDALKQLEEKLQDEFLDPEDKALYQATYDQLKAQHDQLSQLQQRQIELASRQMTDAFDRSADALGFDNLGKGQQLTQEQAAARETVFTAVWALQQAGIVQGFDEDAVKRAYSVAFPQEYQRHLERSLVQSARAQSQARAGDGRFSKTPPAPFDGPIEKDPELHEAFHELMAAER
jgi:hypothetical protein